MYFIQKNVTRLQNNQSSFFLDPKDLSLIKGKLKKRTYHIYYPYKDSEKVIIYQKSIPEVLLYQIKVKTKIRHQDILGTMYSLSIAPELFGDILIIDGNYYIYILPIVRNYFESNFLMVRNTSVELEEIPIDTFKDYERSYEAIHLNVSSNRIDTIVSSICHISRSNIPIMIRKKEIMLNYDYLKDSSYKLRENDTFSIKRIGKFKYRGILKSTKSSHYIVEVFKYI